MLVIRNSLLFSLFVHFSLAVLIAFPVSKKKQSHTFKSETAGITPFGSVQRGYTMDEWVPVNMSWARSPPCTNAPEQDSQCVSDSMENPFPWLCLELAQV